ESSGRRAEAPAHPTRADRKRALHRRGNAYHPPPGVLGRRPLVGRRRSMCTYAGRLVAMLAVAVAWSLPGRDGRGEEVASPATSQAQKNLPNDIVERLMASVGFLCKYPAQKNLLNAIMEREPSDLFAVLLKVAGNGVDARQRFRKLVQQDFGIPGWAGA